MDHLFPLIVIFLGLVLSVRCSRYDFPEGFVFGAGTSAYQVLLLRTKTVINFASSRTKKCNETKLVWSVLVEGAVAEDGRSPSIWDTLCHSRHNGNGDITSDGYHKYKEDVQLMVETGLDAFRFSISWSRLIPNGRGSVNQKGLQFYKNLIHELISHGIEPHATLYHYDHPQYLEDEYGGWLDPRMIKDFTAYADVCFREFGNQVKFWTTINEANIYAIGGYTDGFTPPARCSSCPLGNSSVETYIVGHNMMLAHASASRLYRQHYKSLQGGSIGLSLFTIGFKPSTNSNDDYIAMQRANDFFMGWMLGPLTYGDYPEEMKATVGSRMPIFSEEESEQVKGSSDFLGVIHYLAASTTISKTKSSLSRSPDFYSDLGVSLIYLGNVTAMDYVVAPWAMEEVLDYIKQSYGNPPVYILENGRPTSMKQDFELQQKDTGRIEFLQAYIGSVLKAVKNGSDTRGYFVWSFVDLYELLSGYDFGFGLYSVNYSDPHRKRSPKLSAYWYSDFLKGKSTLPAFQDITALQSNFSSSS